MNKRRGFTPLEIKISKGVGKRFLRGFTLIELLVVISIIALLMSILMPALGKAKKVAQAAICMSNLHQWGLIWKFYTDDNKGYFPDRGGVNEFWKIMWEYNHEDEGDFDDDHSSIPKTLQGMLFCAAAKKTDLEGGRNPYMAWWDDENDNDKWENRKVNKDLVCSKEPSGSYMMNLWISDDTGEQKGITDGFWRTPNVRGAAYAPIMVCAQWKDGDPLHVDDPPQHENDLWTPNAHEIRRACIKRHGDYVNAVFLDFSVRKVGLKELWTLRWHKQWPAVDTRDIDWATLAPWMAHMRDYP